MRYKLLILLTVLPLVTLALYLLMATKEFERDKMAYVYDASVAVSRSLATQMRAEVESTLTRVRPIIAGFVESEGKFSDLAQEIFNSESNFVSVALFRGDTQGNYTKLGTLGREGHADLESSLNDDRLSEMRNRTKLNALNVDSLGPNSNVILLSNRSGELDAEMHYVFTVAFVADKLVSTFRKSILYTSFLVDASGHNLIGLNDLSDTPIAGENFSQFFGPVLQSDRPEGTEKLYTAQQQEIIAAFYQAGIGNTKVVSVVEKRAALKAVDILIKKSLLFFVALLSLTVLISLIASTRLTSTLRELYEATKKVAGGDFDIRVESRSSDEVGGLAEGFNFMAGEVSRLMKDTAEKARLQTELNTVKTVQETLFPSGPLKVGSYQVVGHFEPASECGGDWWSYAKKDNKVLLWIGDATGHGAPAALITSAARSAASIIEMLPDMSPSEALRIMNRAIHDTSKGRIMMTFFLGIIDLEKNVLTYANASHDPPYIIRKKVDKPLSKKDLIPLIDEVGPRLGEKSDSSYNTVVVDLEKGDIVFFYTDGLLDVKNQAGDSLGERNFLKALIKSAGAEGSAENKMGMLRDDVEVFRQGAGLIDDVTMVMCHYEGAA